MVALAPAGDKEKMGEFVTVEGTLPGVRDKIHEIEFGLRNASEIKQPKTEAVITKANL